MKLSPQSEAIVRATAGVVAAHAEEITKVFYPAMFAAHPELLNVFNRANQAIGEQPKALAASVVAFEPWRRYRVVERFDESDDVISLLLAPLTGLVPSHRTGQYVAIAVDLPDGTRQPRQYTISSGPRGDSLRVTVKRVRGVDGLPDGQVSTWVHENAVPGTVLDVSQPAGDVVLDDSDSPLVLVSAGIGITPIAAILEDLSRRQPERTVRLYHADRDHASHALYASLRRQVLAMSDTRAQNWYEADADAAPTLQPARAGYMDLSDVEVPTGAAVFMCGPLPFMRAARTTLIARGVPSERIHYEVFGPDLWAQHPENAAA